MYITDKHFECFEILFLEVGLVFFRFSISQKSKIGVAGQRSEHSSSIQKIVQKHINAKPIVILCREN